MGFGRVALTTYHQELRVVAAGHSVIRTRPEFLMPAIVGPSFAEWSGLRAEGAYGRLRQFGIGLC